MNKRKKIALSLWCAVLAVFPAGAQTLAPDSLYKQEMAAVSSALAKRQAELSGLLKAMPDKADSVNRVYTKFAFEQVKRFTALSVRYAPQVPEALEGLYRARNEVPKDTLRQVLSRLDDELAHTVCAESLRRYVSCRQLGEGDALLEFPCTGLDGQPFDWRVTHGKQVLLLYGGLGCMGDFGRQALKELFDSTSRDDLLVVVYEPCSSLEELQATKAAYPFDYIYVSDFKPVGTPMQVEYGAQATPTCFLTDRQHIIRVVNVGLGAARLRAHISQD